MARQKRFHNRFVGDVRFRGSAKSESLVTYTIPSSFAPRIKETEMKIPFLSGNSETVIDPVCGMDVDTVNPGGGAATHNGDVHYFCGSGCRVAFEKDPNAYLTGEKSIEM